MDTSSQEGREGAAHRWLGAVEVKLSDGLGCGRKARRCSLVGKGEVGEGLQQVDAHFFTPLHRLGCANRESDVLRCGLDEGDEERAGEVGLGPAEGGELERMEANGSFEVVVL